MSRSMLKRLGIGTAMVLALGGAVALSPTSAFAAAQPHCGDTIKHDVTLTRDLDCSGSATNGLVVGADHVNINLNGHKIIGPASSNYGVYLNGYDSVTVRNGTIKGFSFGVYGNYSSKVVLSNLKINLKGDNEYFGVYLEFGQNPHIDGVTVDNAQFGFYLDDNDGLVLTHSAVTGNKRTSTFGVYDVLSAGKIDHFKANGAYYGAYVGGPTPGYSISHSTFNNAGYAGVYVSNSTPLTQNRYTLTSNTANDSDSYGFYATYDTKGSGNKAKGAGTKNFYNVPH
jgi:hypothetical protein